MNPAKWARIPIRGCEVSSNVACIFISSFATRLRWVYRCSVIVTSLQKISVIDMFIRRSAVLAFLTFATLAQAPGASSQSAEGRSAPERLTAETPRVTPGGATFKVPSGWSIVTGKNLVLLEPPEIDTHIAIVDSQAVDATPAVAAAWAVYKPEAKRSLKLVTPRPARSGWEDRQVFDYETSPNERAVVQVLALRAGAAWTVV